MTALRTLWKACIFWVFAVLPGQAGEAVVAVASNFLATAERLAEDVRRETGHAITLAHGSTGRLYAQIIHGAPFDLFLSADAERPRLLAGAGLATEVRTYALGRLVLLAAWPDATVPQDLRGARVAIANSEIAPYGAAAEEVLQGWGFGIGDLTRLRGDSVAQAASLFATGNAEFAIVSAAQAKAVGAALFLPLSEALHSPLMQDAALLARGAENPAARAFFDYLASPEARDVIGADGYGLPVPAPGEEAVGQ